MKLTQFENSQGGYVRTDAEQIYATRSWQDMEKTRQQALDDYMVGHTDPTPPTTKQPTLPDLKADNPYSTQINALSKVSLLDENLNPTQTYTQYIQDGGQPIPGFESQHQTLLQLDRIDDHQQQFQRGEITEDEMLWDLYATDILDTMGYKIRSVGWWQQKYYNNDFSNPLENNYLRNQVILKAREYHNQLMAQKALKNTTTQTSHLNSLLNKGDLSNEDFEHLFPELAKSIRETQNDEDYMLYVTSGRLAAQNRIYQSPTGDTYYLHTNGELYLLSNEKSGPKVASYKQDEQGHYTEISLNNSDTLDLAQSFKSGFFSVPTNFMKLSAWLFSKADMLDLAGKDEQIMMKVDSYFNDELAFFNDTEYVDMDGFKLNDIKDWGMFLTYTAGAMTSGMVTGQIAGHAASWGTQLQASGHPILGTTIKVVPSLYQRSTGFFNGTPTNLTGWGLWVNHFKTVGVYMTKDFMNVEQSLLAQRMQMQIEDYNNDPSAYDPSKYASTKTIQAAAFKVALFNGAVSMCLAGGMDDNQTERWASIFTSNNDVKAPLGTLAKHLTKYRVAYNTVADFMDNFITNYATDMVHFNEDGTISKLISLENNPFLTRNQTVAFKTLAQATINTLPTLQKQLWQRDFAADNAEEINQRLLSKLNEQEQKYQNDPEKLQAIRQIKSDYMADLKTKVMQDQNGEALMPTPADRTLYAASRLHERLKDDKNVSFVTKEIDRVLSPKMVKFYKETHDLCVETYEKKLDQLAAQKASVQENGVRSHLKSLISNHFQNKYSSKKAAESYAASKLSADTFADRLIDTYFVATDSKKADDRHTTLAKKLSITAEQLSKVEETMMNATKFAKKYKDVDYMTPLIAKANEIGVDENDLLGSVKFLHFKNETDDRKTLNAERAAYNYLTLTAPDLYIKIDDNNIAIVGVGDWLSKIATDDGAAKISLGMHALGSADNEIRDAGIELMLNTIWGDSGVEAFKKNKLAESKKSILRLFDEAINNHVITKADAALFLNEAANYSDRDILKNFKNIFTTDISMNTLNSFDKLSELEKYAVVYSSLKAMTDKKTKRFSSKQIAAEALFQSDDLSNITLDIIKNGKGIELDDYTRRFAEEAFKNKLVNDSVPLATDSIIRGLKDAVGDNSEISDAELYKQLKALAKNSNDSEVAAMCSRLEDIIKLTKKYKDIKFEGDKVILNLAKYTSKKEEAMLKTIERTPENILSKQLESGTIETPSKKEIKKKLDVAAGGQWVVELNDSNMDEIKTLFHNLQEAEYLPDYLKEPKSAAEMKTYLSENLERDGFAVFKTGTEQDSNIIEEDLANELAEKLKTFNPKEIVEIVDIFDAAAGKKIEMDYYSMLAANINIDKVSHAADATAYRLNGVPIYMIPYDINTVDNKTGIPIFITEDMLNTIKAGRAASKAKGQELAKFNYSNPADVNKDIAHYLMLEQYIDTIWDNRADLEIRISKEDIQKIKDLGIARAYDAEKTSDDIFYTYSNPIKLEDGTEYYTLTLDNNAKAAMKKYVATSDNVNVFKIMPFISDDSIDTSLKFLTPEAEGLDIPNILGGKFTDSRGLYNILLETFQFDQTGKVRENFLKALLDAKETGEYNPFSSSKEILDIDKLRKSKELKSIEGYDKNFDDVELYEFYKEHANLIKGIGDYAETVLDAYKALNENYLDDNDNKDYLLWLRHGNVLQEMVTAVEEGRKIDYETIRRKYLESLDLAGYSLDIAPNKDMTSSNFYYSPNNIPSDTVVSKGLLDRARGVDYKLVNEDGSYALPDLGDASIDAAYKFVKDNINDFDQTQNILKQVWDDSTNNYKLYTPNSTAKLWQILTAADGHILIQDLDELTRIEADAYNEFFEKLGYTKAQAQKIKTNVDELYAKLKGFIFEDRGTRVELSNKVISAARTASAQIKQTKDTIVTNGKGYYKAMDAAINDYVKETSDAPKITSQNLIEALTDRSNDILNGVEPKTELDAYRQKLFNTFGEISVMDNADYTGQTAIDEISADINIYGLSKASQHLHDRVVASLNIKDKEVNDKLIDTLSQQVLRLSGSDKLTEFAKYQFIDLSTGEEYDFAVQSKQAGVKSSVDLVSTLWDSNKKNSDWIGKALLVYNKKPKGSEVDFTWKILNDEQDVINLKNDALLKVFDENNYLIDKDIQSLVDKMGAQEKVNMANKIISEGITKSDKLALLKKQLEKTNVSESILWKSILLPQYFTTDLNKNTIRDITGDMSGESSDENINKIKGIITYGISYNAMDKEHQDVVNNIQKTVDTMSNLDLDDEALVKIHDIETNIDKGKDLKGTLKQQYLNLYGLTEEKINGKDSNEAFLNAFKKYIATNIKKPEVLDYLLNSKRRSLNDKYTNYLNGFDDATILKAKLGDSNVEVDTKDLSSFFNSNKYDGDLKEVRLFDTETGNIKDGKKSGTVADSLDDVFQISFRIFTRDENGKLHEEVKTFFVDHKNRVKWYKEHINENNKFFQENDTYKNAAETYKNLTGEEDNLISVEELKTMFNNPDVDLYMAYNGDNFDFRLLKESGITNIKTLDVLDIVIRDEADSTKKINQEEVYKRTFGDDFYQERHGAEEDVADMAKIIMETLDSDNNLSYERIKLVRDLLNLIPEDYNTDKIRVLFGLLDKDLATGNIIDNSGIRLTKEDFGMFKDYNPTLENIKTLQRSYNYMFNDQKGNLYFKLLDTMGFNKDNVYHRVVQDTVSKKNIAHVLASKMATDETMNAPKALNDLYYTYKNKHEDGTFSKFLDLVSKLDSDTLLELNIDKDKFDSDAVRDNYFKLENVFKQGESGFDNGKIEGVSIQAAEEYKNLKDIIPLVNNMASFLMDNKDILSQEDLDFAQNMFLHPLTMKEGLDISDLEKYKDTTFKYKSPIAKRLEKEIKNLLDGNRGTAQFYGLYSMMSGINEDYANTLYEITNPYTSNEAIVKLENFKAGDIGISKYALEKLFNVYDIEELRADDGNLYLLSITNPADNMNSLLPLRVRLIDDNSLNIRLTPKTQEILRNRDFDGDHTMTTAIAPGMKPMVGLLHKYLYSPFDIYESTYSYLNKANRFNENLPEYNRAYALKIGADKDVIKVCHEFEKYLKGISKKASLENYDKTKIAEFQDNLAAAIKNTKGFETVFEDRFLTDEDKDAFAKDMAKMIGFREAYVGTGQTVRFIDNPALFEKGYSSEQRRLMFAANAIHASNIMDPEIGFHQKKLAKQDVAEKVITRPLLDLYTPSLYLTDDMSDLIDSRIDSKTQYKKYMSNLTNDIIRTVAKNFNTDSDTVETYINDIKAFRTKAFEEAKDADTETLQLMAKTYTMNLIRDLDLFTKHSDGVNVEFLEALDKVSQDDYFKNQLEKTKALNEKYMQLRGTQEYISGDSEFNSTLSDALLEQAIKNRYENPETGMTEIRHKLSNNSDKATVFFAIGFSTDPDDIRVTSDNFAVNNLWVLPNNLEPNKDVSFKRGNTYHKDEVIGTINGEPWKAKADFTIQANIDGNIIVSTSHSLPGKKITGAGIFKGVAKASTCSDASIDIVADLKNCTKKFDKYSGSFNIAKALRNAQETTRTIDGVTYKGFVIKGIPVNVIGDDKSYTQKLSYNDPSSSRTMEIMTSQGNLGLLNIGLYGSSVLKKTDDGNFVLDFSGVSAELQANDTQHDVAYSDTGTFIMYTRSAMLARALGEERLLGLVNAGGKHDYSSIDDYLHNLRSSREKINSESSLQEQYAMMRALGTEEFRKLYNKSNLTSFVFGREIERKLNPTEPFTFTDYFLGNIKDPSAKNSGKEELAQYAKRVPGHYVCRAAEDIEDKSLIQNGLLHVPFDAFYRGVYGYNVNKNALIDAALKGYVTPTTYYKNSAMISNNFTPVEEYMGTKLDSVVNRNIVANGTKTIIEAQYNDTLQPSTIQVNLFDKGSGDYDLAEYFTSPDKPTIKANVAKAIEAQSPIAAGDLWTRLAYIMSLGYDQSQNSLGRFGRFKGIDNIELHDYVPQFINKMYDDKSMLNYTAVGLDKTVPIQDAMREERAMSKGFMLRKDVKDAGLKPVINKNDIEQFMKQGTVENYVQAQKTKRENIKKEKQSVARLIAALNSQNTSIVNNRIEFTWDTKQSATEWRTWYGSRSGIQVDDEQKLAFDIGVKNMYAESQYYQEEYMSKLLNLKQSVASADRIGFEDYAKYQWLKAAEEADTQGYEYRANYMGAAETLESLKVKAENFEKAYSGVAQEYNSYVDSLMSFAQETAAIRHEPLENYYVLFAPYVPTTKQDRDAVVYSNIRSMMGLKKYDPMSIRNAFQQNFMFNFFDGSERLIKDLCEARAAETVSDAMLGKYSGNALIDNTKVSDKVYEIIDAEDLVKELKTYSKFDSDLTKEVLNVVQLYTDVDLYRLQKNAKDDSEILRGAFHRTKARALELKEEYTQLTGKPATLTNVYADGNSNYLNESTRLIAKKTADAMWAEMMVGQRLIEVSPTAQRQLLSYINSLQQEGYCLVNRYCQKLKKGEFIGPTTDNSLAYLKDNVEIAFNSKTDAHWAQFILEKAISGEVYLARQDLADQAEKHLWTSKPSSRAVKTLKKISSLSASFQMSLPAKLLSRMIRFTGFDYAMGAVGNLETIPNMSRAAKELSAALYSNGANIKPGTDLYDYLMREGQPSYGKGVGTKDPINFTEDLGTDILSKITNKMSSPLEFQNHLGRYAIYLTAKESFDKGDPWYGPVYFNHEAIDKIQDNRDKAMYVMDYMLGSPGGFPALSKKTSGFMMYSTFPMNLTRTLGAYGMSVGKLFQEGITEDNANQWSKTVIMPSLATAGLVMLGNAIISAICEKYGVDEETEEKWKEEGVTIDPIGTLLGGTPSVVYDSMNPFYNVKEMFINPFTNKYNKTLPEKGYGWIKANVLSKFNPAIKTPIEILTGKDIYGDTANGYQTSDPLFAETKKHQYTALENGMRKVLGFFVGSGVANSIVDERKVAQLDSNDETPSLNSYLWKGITKGISSDLGNQKSWKKNTSSYYSMLTDMKAWKNNYAKSAEGNGNSANAYNYNYLDIEDMADADKLYYNRNYSRMYGEFNQDDYNRVYSTLKKYITEHRDASTVYAYIVKEYNDNKVSEATMRAALNNNSILRKINTLKKGNMYIEYLRSLSNDEKIRLQEAIEFEEEMYPILQKLFPDNTNKSSVYLPSYKKDYVGSGSGSPSKSPYTPTNRYYPGRYYPSTYKFRKISSKNGVPWKRVTVNVSPQMAIWNQDKNLTSYDTGLSKENSPKWLRSRDYTSHVYQI